jgi:hypothetical protein
MNYTTLKTAVASYTHRSDVDSLMDTFIELAEASLRRELKLRETETTETGTTTNSLIDLPVDFGAVSRLTITKDGVERTLDYAADPNIYAGTNATSYAFEQGKLRINPDVGTGQAYTLYYTLGLTGLSSGNTTNWLIETAPDLYMYATSLELAKHIRDQEQVGSLNQIVGGLIDSIRRADERKGQPMTGGLRVKPRR